MPKRVSARRRARSAAPQSILYPLDVIYGRTGVSPPQVKAISPYDIPLPYRSLLVHESDMTITLEQHFGGRIVLRALSTFSTSGWYFRRVLLALEYSGRPVEMGALRINLNIFSQPIRARILRNEIPLGRLLRDGHIDFKSHAKVFLGITPNPEMMGVFWMREPRRLYGRQTEVIHKGRHVGDIVEVLPLV